jgi:hypothetical protein
MYIHVYVHTCMLPFVSASTVPSPHSHGPTRTDGRYWYTIYAPTLPRAPIVVRAYRRGEHAPRTRPGVRACVRARSSVCVRAPASAPTRASTSRRVRALPAAAERRIDRRAGVPVGVDLQREHRRVEHRLRLDIVPGMRRFRPGAHRGGLRSVGRRRMRGCCARLRRRCAPAQCVCMYTHVCCASCVRVRFPLLTAVDRHARMDRYPYTVYTHALPCTPIVERACRRGGHARLRAQARVRAR